MSSVSRTLWLFGCDSVIGCLGTEVSSPSGPQAQHCDHLSTGEAESGSEDHQVQFKISSWLADLSPAGERLLEKASLPASAELLA